ncbi:MAG: hypothetical protein HFH08_03660 [Bacilli bacterium]|nr:hypothetical protein [Bacilli bacterium]
MRKKNKLIVFALSATILLSGCSLSREQISEQVVEPVVSVREENTTIGGFSIFKSVIMVPSTLEEKDEVMTYIESLEGDNHIVVYHADDSLNQRAYHEEIFEASLEENPMIQIYYWGSKKSEALEKELALYYPNVTYVEEDENVEEVISTYYRPNFVTSSCIKGIRNSVNTVESFDLERTLEEVKDSLPDIRKEDVIGGLTTFTNYVENTTLFSKVEALSEKAEEALRPYVEAAIPIFEKAWDSTKPYVEEGKDKAVEFYEDIKPELSEAYEDAKGYIKSILGN